MSPQQAKRKFPQRLKVERVIAATEAKKQALQDKRESRTPEDASASED